MDATLKLHIEAAERLRLPFTFQEDYQGIEIKLAGARYIFRGGHTPFNDGASESISVNKYCVNALCERHGLPVPELIILSKDDFVDGAWNLPPITYPVVAKPGVSYYGNGKDVFCNIQNETTLIDYLDKNADKYQFINVEKFEKGLTDYRVLVFFNKVVAVAKREPASIVGDGVHTIADLIALENDKRCKTTNIKLKEMMVDAEYLTRLAELNLTVNSIPAAQEKIVLCYTCNDERGGNMLSLGNDICPENAALAIRAANILNLNVVGLDIICEDIMLPISKTRGFILEANCNPGIAIHEKAFGKKQIPVSELYFKKIIKMHPLAYAKNYFAKMLSPFGFYLRSLSVLIGFIYLIRLLHK